MKNVLTSIFLLSSFLLFAQQGAISGRVNNEDNTPLVGVTIELTNADNLNEVRYEVTDDSGLFGFQHLAVGNYALTVSYIGYTTYFQDIQIEADKNITIETITLAEDSRKLDEVEVLARKKPTVEVLPDKLIFNVSSSATSTGLSGLELLRKAPGVQIDNSNNIILKGSPGVRVFIDGKPSYLDGDQLTQLLSSMRSEEIEKIEIITSPSSKYEAEGTAGIINIIMKKGSKKEGLSGSWRADLAGLLRTGKYKGSYSFLGNYVNKGTSITGAVSFSHGTNFSYFSNLLTQDRSYLMQSESDDKYTNTNIRLNYDQEINDKNSLSVGLRLVFINNDRTVDRVNDIYTLNLVNSANYIEQLHSPSSHGQHNVQIIPSINYYYEDKTFGSFFISADYSNYNTDGQNNINNYYYTDETRTIASKTSLYRQASESQFNIFAAKIDWNKSWEKIKLEAGFKYSNILAENKFKQFSILGTVETLDLSKSNQFVYDENVYAAYIQGYFMLGKVTLSLGLRDEYTYSAGTLKHIETGNVESKTAREYNNLFPSAGISYKINDIHSLSLQYSRRLRRPPYQSLNPFEVQESELQYNYGNPNLTPEYSNKIELNYSLFSTVSLSLSYLKTEDIIFPSFETEGSISYQTTRNLGFKEVWSANLSSPLMLKSAPWWSGFMNLNFNYFTNSGILNGEQLSISAVGFHMYAESSFRLPKDFSISVSGWFLAPSVWAASIEHETIASLDAAIQKKLLKGRMNIKLYFQDILSTAYARFKNQAVGQILDNGIYRWPGQRIGVNVSYNFGNNQNQKSKRRVPNALDEEEQRLQSSGGIGGGR